VAVLTLSRLAERETTALISGITAGKSFDHGVNLEPLAGPPEERKEEKK
jgi:hypothetical protein